MVYNIVLCRLHANYIGGGLQLTYGNYIGYIAGIATPIFS